jgi:hypothetical protein
MTQDSHSNNAWPEGLVESLQDFFIIRGRYLNVIQLQTGLSNNDLQEPFIHNNTLNCPFESQIPPFLHPDTYKPLLAPPATSLQHRLATSFYHNISDLNLSLTQNNLLTTSLQSSSS